LAGPDTSREISASKVITNTAATIVAIQPDPVVGQKPGNR
jgi:hypothetical protein